MFYVITNYRYYFFTVLFSIYNMYEFIDLNFLSKNL